MRNAYLYPISSNAGQVFLSLYIKNFMDYLSDDFYFVNRLKPSNKGILDIVNYMNTIKFVFLNWIEDLPDKRGGIIQAFFFILVVYIFKIKKIKIVWIMHNKYSHYGANLRLKRILFNFILRKSDYIITHAKDGIILFNRYGLKDKEKIKYFPHPLNKDFIAQKSPLSTDILIWGSIIPYKGIDIFLKYLHENNLHNQYKILIVGKVKPDSYENTLLKYCNKNIQLINRFIPEEELKKIMSESRLVVFTYVSESILSSGALMDSLSYGMEILAPHIGAFKDAQEEGLVKTFNNYNELVTLINKNLEIPKPDNRTVIDRFIKKHNWEMFAKQISCWLS